MGKCNNFINKVRKSRFTKVRNRQVNKFYRLMGKDRDRDRDRELTAQPLANSTQLPAQNNSNKWVINLSSTSLSQAQKSLLAKEPNYAVALNPHLEYITSIESACQNLDHEEAEELRADINRMLRSSQPPKPNLTKAELKALTELKKDSNRIVLTANKSVAIIVMDRKDYIDRAANLLSLPAYRTIERDPSNKLKAKLITLLRSLKRETRLEDHLYKYMYVIGCSSPKFYGLPKIHNANTPLRPIVSRRDSVIYGIVKVLAKILKPLIGKSLHHVHGTKDFVDKVSKVTLQPGEYLLI